MNKLSTIKQYLKLRRFFSKLLIIFLFIIMVIAGCVGKNIQEEIKPNRQNNPSIETPTPNPTESSENIIPNTPPIPPPVPPFYVR